MVGCDGWMDQEWTEQSEGRGQECLAYRVVSIVWESNTPCGREASLLLYRLLGGGQCACGESGLPRWYGGGRGSGEVHRYTCLDAYMRYERSARHKHLPFVTLALPSPLVPRVVCGMWYVVCGMWYVVCGMWYVVGGRW